MIVKDSSAYICKNILYTMRFILLKSYTHYQCTPPNCLLQRGSQCQ